MRQGVVEAVDQLGTAFVRCDDCYGFWRDMSALERIDTPDPPRAPERVLAPGIVCSADTCDGKPRIEGTRLRCDAMYSYWKREMAGGYGPETAMDRVAMDYHTTALAIRDAVVWQAAVRYAKERRKAKRKERKDG
jgi:uncharacterized protein (DUF433 family)